MNVRFISEERIKKAASIVVAGTIALTSVVGLTGCGEKEYIEKEYIMKGSDLDGLRVLCMDDDCKYIVYGINYNFCDSTHYRDKISGDIYCISDKEECDFLSSSYLMSPDSVVEDKPIYNYLTDEELVKNEFSAEDIIKIYKRINSNQEKGTSLEPKTRIIV